jgi:adenosylhomocysteine nucleosidase
MAEELESVRRELGMTAVQADVTGEIRGSHGGITIITVVTNIGLAAAQRATDELFSRHGTSIDHLFVVGIAGAYDPGLHIGDVLIPEAVVDERDGIARVPVNLSGRLASGVIYSTDRTSFDAEYYTLLQRNKASLVDMESGAIAAVCERNNCPFTIVRAVSDKISEHGETLDIFHLVNEDGSTKYLAVIKYVLFKPWRIAYLVSMATGMKKAVDASTKELLMNIRTLLSIDPENG